MSKFKRIVGFLLVIYIVGFILIFISLSLSDIVVNSYLLAAILSLFFVIAMFLLLNFLKGPGVSIKEGGLVRYSMLCRNCNWEWMSNTTDKKTPSKCPNCGERNRLELTGWRRVQHYHEQKNQELSKFLKNK